MIWLLVHFGNALNNKYFFIQMIPQLNPFVLAGRGIFPAYKYYKFKAFSLTNRLPKQKQKSYKPHKYVVCSSYVYKIVYSNSIVPGGLLVRSYITRFTPFTSFMIRVITFCNTSNGISEQSAVMKSLVLTARSAIA